MTSVAISACSPSNSISKTAPASSGYPALTYASTACVVSWSIISSATGTIPRAMMSETALLASSIVRNTARIVFTAWGTGSSRTVTSVQIPSVPSDHTKTPKRS
jgi:hypothetical protein